MDADWAQELPTELGVDHDERLPILEALAASDIVAEHVLAAFSVPTD
jgi:hypothetical protein